MSIIRPARCLLSRRLAAAMKPAAAATPQCHASFHSSARLEARKKRFKNIRAEEMGLTTPAKIEEFTKENFKPYSPEELEILRKHYTPEQMEALEAGEASIDPEDLTIQGRLRNDPYRLPYLDDFSRLIPSIDRKPRIHAPPNPKARFMSETEFSEDVVWTERNEKLKPLLNWSKMTEEEWAATSEDGKKQIQETLEKLLQDTNGPEDSDNIQFEKDFFEKSTMTDNNAPSNSALAPALGKDIPGVSGMYTNPIDPEDMGLDDDGIYQDLKRRTGMTVQEMMQLTVKILVVRLVHNQTRLGKIRSVWVLAIAGNKNGRLGIGEAKSVENSVAVSKAKLLAIRNMQPIRRYEDRTIHGSVEAKVGATIVKLDARPPGFGLRVPARMFEMFRAAGIHDIAGRMPRARNPMNSVKATFQALTNQRNPDEIAIGRGKKLVDVRKVYYGGNVL